MKILGILIILLIAGCASDGPDTPLTYWHPDQIDEDIPRLTKHISELDAERSALLIELGDKANEKQSISSRINTHAYLRRAEWELEKEVNQLKQQRDENQ